ncbi:unnamed protein product [Urochloa decumbens]|uniref:Cathepsin propeptide inhibitor domain-containing protein n=1 Tax=Urochloa decumbens TaxID=240449 RepID=A0ABC9BAT0_9POAL
MAFLIFTARSATSRSAAAVSRSGALVAAAASDRLLPRRSSLSFYCSRLPPFKLPGPAPGKVEFVADEKDLESDEAIWALYERWCKAFNQERSPDEMACRFNVFKETVLSVDSTNKARLPYRFEINKFADGKKMELMSPKVPFTVSRARVIQIAGKLRRANIGKDPEGAGELKKEA